MSLDAFLAWAGRVQPVFIDATIRGTIVLLAALALTHLLRRRSAATRHLIWVGAVLIQLMLPVFATWGPQWNVAVSPGVASVIPSSSAPANSRVSLPSVAAKARTSPVLQQVVAAPSESVQPSANSTSDTALGTIARSEILAILWIAGALVILARLAIGTSIVARLARTGHRVDDGNWLSLAQKLSNNLEIDRPLTLLRGDKLGVPVTWGIVYPVVLLPHDSDQWSEERRKFVLVHEMAHVKRFDALTQLAGQLALALFWFNPLVWIANRRMQLEREHACDDYVLRHGTAPSIYAEELLSMVRSLGESDRSTQPAFAALAMARRSEFEGRMLSILDPVLERHPINRIRTLASMCAALVLVIPLAALHPYERADVARLAQPARAAVSHTMATSDGCTTSSCRADSSTKPMTFSAFGAAAKEFATKLASPSLDVSLCNRATRNADRTSVHVHEDDDSSTIIEYLSSVGPLCASARIVGRYTISADETDVTALAPGAMAIFDERGNSAENVLALTGFPDGRLVRSYQHNGAEHPFDAEARRWFAGYLPHVLAEAAVNVDQRVSRWRSAGGVGNVLVHIKGIASAASRRAHYESLLADKSLPSSDIDNVIQSASETLANSASDLRAVLSLAAPKAQLSLPTRSAFIGALSTLGNSSDKGAVLEIYGQTDDREMLLGIMRVAATIGSSGERSRVLQALVARYLGKNDRGLEASYFEVAKGLGSSGDQRNVLIVAMPYIVRSPSAARLLIEAERTIAGSGDRAMVLISLASSGAITNKELRDAFFSAAGELPSEGDRSRVLQAAASLRQ